MVENINSLIGRQAAIHALNRRLAPIPIEQEKEMILLRKDLSELPSVDPKRITGYWVPVSVAEYIGVEATMCKYEISHHICSECLEMALEKDGDEVLSDFCPHCGAKMEVTK